jgi:hypothetical protein
MSQIITEAIPPGYKMTEDGKLAKPIPDNRELRRIYGPDPRTGEMSRKYFPFFVGVPIRESVLLGVGRRHEVFTHAQNGQQAATQAGKFWDHWFRQMTGKNGPDDYPKLTSTEVGNWDTAPISLVLDDDDFDAYWADASKMPNFHAGHPQHPITFMLRGTEELFSLDKWKTRNMQ